MNTNERTWKLTAQEVRDAIKDLTHIEVSDSEVVAYLSALNVFHVNDLMMPWGKYKGESIRGIWCKDPAYLKLVRKNDQIFNGVQFLDVAEIIDQLML